ncbi:MFS transporter [Sphingomonas sp. LY54]|uniref:MFS transporter n=1 Tax=Sphingomonas sp. LY54 TaxID=3095343 RepID=UPI002D7A06B0|nr:MFS transporter [Sphingomonas sp. LY54]WRP28176.1 MFS transporter [Sphingomonas sp. LY54]
MAQDSAIAPLKVPIFRACWSANLVANIGVMAQAVTVAWLMTSLTDGSPTLVASVQTAASLPLVLLSLPAGAFADLYDRRRVMLAAQTLTFAAAAGLLLLALSGQMSPAALLALTFAGGAGFALANPAWHASIRLQVADDRLLEPAILLNAVGFNLARCVGPAVGGGILAVGGPIAALSASTAAILPLLATLARWRPPLHAAPQRERLASAIGAGLRYVALRPTLAALTIRAFLFTFSGASVWALTPVLAYDRIGGDAAILGLLVAMFGAGAFAGAMTRARFAHWPRARFLSACTLLYALAAAMLGLAPSLVPAALAMVLTGAGWVAGLSGLNVAIQVHSARWVAARAISLLQVALFLGLALGSFCWGVVADSYGLTAAMLGSAAAMLATLALGNALPVVSDDSVDLTPAPPAREDAVALRVERLHRPAPDNEDRFLALMRQLGRARRRDGARRWELARDAGGGWRERFMFPDEVAALRWRARRTREDALLESAIAALSDGEKQE